MFAFKLQSVLDYRKNIEEKILNDFSEKKRRFEIEKKALKSIIAERVNSIRELKRMQSTVMDANSIASHLRYIEQIRENEKKQKIIISGVKGELEALRIELLEAVKKSKVLEKLKESQKEGFERAVRAFEQVNSDEMAVLKFGRREK